MTSATLEGFAPHGASTVLVEPAPASRRDFPLLSDTPRGRRLTYLDAASTTPKPRQVLEAMNDFYVQGYANVHRGVYELAEEATAAYEGVRHQVADFVGANHRGVVFCRNCTDAINLVAHGWARRHLKEGDEILLTGLEHHSNLVPWQQAARDTGATLRFLPLLEDGRLDMELLDDLVTDRTRLVAVSGMSNVLGTVTPLQPVVGAARLVGARVLVDAAQLAAHQRVHMGRLDVDFVAFSGHKVLGPTGVGVLAARPELLEQMDPLITGGEMVLDVTLEGATWNEIPHRFEAGTPMITEVIGLGAALDYVESVGFDGIRAHDRRLLRRGLDVLGEIQGLTLYGGDAVHNRAASFCFNLTDDRGELIHPHDVGTVLAGLDIAVRVGHHCAKPLMRHLGVPATCRASCHIYNTEAELEQLAAGLQRAAALFC